MKKNAKSSDLPPVGKTLQRLRQALNLSLGDLSESSGVSKSIISQIEKNESNPTLATIYRLSNALETDVGDILGLGVSRSPSLSLTPAHQIPLLRSEDGLCTLGILNSLETVEWVQWYEFKARIGGVLESSPHQPGSVEHLHVMSGELEVRAGDRKMKGTAGSVLRYGGDCEHSLRNVGNEEAVAGMMLVLKNFLPRSPG